MIQLTDAQIEVLGTPNFKAASFADVLIGAGLYENKENKAEYKQAVFIHWATELQNKHGEKWREEGGKILEAALTSKAS